MFKDPPVQRVSLVLKVLQVPPASRVRKVRPALPVFKVLQVPRA